MKGWKWHLSMHGVKNCYKDFYTLLLLGLFAIIVKTMHVNIDTNSA